MDKLLLKYLISSNYLNIDAQDLKLQLLAHPDYPSLKSITDTLDYFEIENVAATIPKEYLDKLPKNFLTLVETEKGKQLVLSTQNTSGSKIGLLDDSNKTEKLNKTDFVDRWDPTIIAIEPQEKSSGKKVSKISNPVAVSILAILAVSLFAFNNFQIIPLLYYVAAIAIGYVSFLIAKEDLGFNSASVAKFCTKYSNTSCADVIKSSGAKIFNFISLSDIVVTYSISTLLFLIFIGYNNPLFFILGAISVPVLAYSIFYQWRVLKKWCLLCLAIAGITMVQFVLTTINFETFTFPVQETVYYLFIFSSILFTWTKIKPVLKTNNELKSSQIDFMKFKRNFNLFKLTINNQESVQENNIYQPDLTLDYGNPNANLKIIAVTNPLCGFCKASFETYAKLLDTHGDHFHITFALNINYKDTDNQGTQIAHKLLEKHYREDKKASFSAFKDWFTDRNIAGWQKKYGISQGNDFIKNLEEQSNWCRVNNINYTPATIINTKLFPREYDIKDLVYFIDDLIAESSLSANENEGKSVAIEA
ncbi:thioredoxin domain-containing protein [Flavobacteriaceae bacterium R38]|nr:thioredoxin domain-containing protein [Flavobacteriaceae bacterium R38]